MEQLNSKRESLRQSEKTLNESISRKEEQLANIAATLKQLTDREKELRSKLEKNHLMLKDFDQFIQTTERSNEKIEESVVTLLYVVKKESDILFRKKQ